MAYPKPTKESRETADANRKKALLAFRSIQVSLAKNRDNNQCVFCFFENGVNKKAEEVHHVYGRGRKADDWRENYLNLLCTCRDHHPQPIKTPAGNKTMQYVEDVLDQANRRPINKHFA